MTNTEERGGGFTPVEIAKANSIKQKDITRGRVQHTVDADILQRNAKALHNGEIPDEIRQRLLGEPYKYGTPEMRRQALALGYRPDSYNVFRYQQTAGAAQAGVERGGTFYSVGEPGEGDYYKTPDFANNFEPGYGGQHLVKTSLSPKRPLILPAQRGLVGAKAITALKGEPFTRDLIGWLIDQKEGGQRLPPPEVDKFLRENEMVPRSGPLWGRGQKLLPFEN